MTQSLRETLQSLVNQSDDSKLSLAYDAYKAILPKLKEFDTENDGLLLVYTILGATAAADGEISTSEYAFIAALLKATNDIDLNRDEVFQIAKAAAKDGKGYKLVQALANAMNSEEHANLVLFVATLCSMDDTISADEISFIESLM